METTEKVFEIRTRLFFRRIRHRISKYDFVLRTRILTVRPFGLVRHATGRGASGAFPRIAVFLVLCAALCLGCQKMELLRLSRDLGKDILYRDTVWNRGGSPYRIEKSLLIPPEVTLEIRPGVEVLLGPEVGIWCQGRIVAQGKPDLPIRILPLAGKPWDKIDCFGGRLEDGGRVPVNVFQHCEVAGGRGIVIRAGSVNVKSCTFRDHVSTPVRLEFSSGRILESEFFNNSTEQEAASGNGGGIMVYTDKEVLVADNNVHHNISHGGRDGGGGIYAYAYDTGRVMVAGNRVFRNRSDRHGGGLVAYGCSVEGNLVLDNEAGNSGGGIYAVNATLSSNRIMENKAGRGGGVYAENTLLRGNTLSNNTAPRAMGGGLFYYGEGRIESNTFLRNGVPPGAGPGEAVVVSGRPVFTRNNIPCSTGHALRVQTHSLAPDLDATGNYWGTRHPGTVLRRIHDWLDDAEVGLVDWQGFREGWVPDAPPPSPGSLLWQSEGDEWTLSWSYPGDVAVSGFRVYMNTEPDLPPAHVCDLGPEERSYRASRPGPAPFQVRLSAYREGAKGEHLESGFSREALFKAREEQERTADSAHASAEALRPSGCESPPATVSGLEASTGMTGALQDRARYEICEAGTRFSPPVFDSGPVEAGGSLPLPSDLLEPGREYAWRVAFQDGNGDWTAWSDPMRFCTPALGDDLLRGPILQDAVWGPKVPQGEVKAVYDVTGNLLVSDGVSVNILGGTVLNLSPGVWIRIRGNLSARGEQGRAIRFTGDPDAPWGKLFFEGRASESEPGVPGDEEGAKGVLSNCVVEHGSGILVEEAGPLITGCLIRKNHGSGIAVRNAAVRIKGNRILENQSSSNGGGIYAYGSRLIFIEDNEILNNFADEDGGGVFAYGYRSTTAVNLLQNRILNNRCKGDGGGVWASRSSMKGNRIDSNRAEGNGGGLFATFALVEDNEILNNRAGQGGGGAYAETNSTLVENILRGNRCRGAFGGAAYLNFWGMSIKNEVFRGNRVTGNRAGSPEDNGGIYLNGSMIFENNRIFRNRGSQLYNANPAGRPPLAAPNCYWGTKSVKAVEAGIHDAADDPGLAPVLYKPIAKTPEEADGR